MNMGLGQSRQAAVHSHQCKLVPYLPSLLW